MVLAVDVHYKSDYAVSAGVIFNDWQSEKPDDIFWSTVPMVEKYESGQFYKREMPCIIKLINDHALKPNLIIVDGFVILGGENKPGLGMYLFEELGGNIPIIGVAKKAFINSNPESKLYRGESKRALYITSVGVDLKTAKKYISTMHGNYRIPTLLKFVDRESRTKKGSK